MLLGFIAAPGFGPVDIGRFGIVIAHIMIFFIWTADFSKQPDVFSRRDLVDRIGVPTGNIFFRFLWC